MNNITPLEKIANPLMVAVSEHLKTTLSSYFVELAVLYNTIELVSWHKSFRITHYNGYFHLYREVNCDLYPILSIPMSNPDCLKLLTDKLALLLFPRP